MEPVSIPNRALMNIVFYWDFTESHRKTAQLGLQGGMNFKVKTHGNWKKK